MSAVVQRRRPRGWWRRNIVWLVVLPVSIALAAAATAHRLVNVYRYADLFERIDSAGVGETAHFEAEYYEAWGFNDPALKNTWINRVVDVRVLGVKKLETLPELTLSDITSAPKGSVAWQVNLELTAAKGTDLAPCNVMLVTSDGARYGDASIGATDPLQQGNPCAPGDSLDSLAPGGTWKATHVILAREGETFDELWLSFGNPHYVTVELP